MNHFSNSMAHKWMMLLVFEHWIILNFHTSSHLNKVAGTSATAWKARGLSSFLVVSLQLKLSRSHWMWKLKHQLLFQIFGLLATCSTESSKSDAIPPTAKTSPPTLARRTWGIGIRIFLNPDHLHLLNSLNPDLQYWSSYQAFTVLA